MISIILPTYNSISFLEERVVSIMQQTQNDWECLVIDGISGDGTWEFIRNITKTDSRFKLYQYPPKGVYDAWNKGVNLALGDYIYFATSDDTMQSDCLEKLHKALENNMECGIAHCCLTIIDVDGKPTTKLDWNTFPAQKYYANKIHTLHVRQAPLDGILYCTHGTIYHSFTQLLIRKQVFDQFGLFSTFYGAIADFEWGMRVALGVHAVHVPEYLATWRFYEGQQTNLDYFNSWQHKRDVMSMVKSAIIQSKPYFKPHKPLLLYQLWLAKEMLRLKKERHVSYSLKDYYFKLYIIFYAKYLKNRLLYNNFLVGNP